MPLPKLNTLNLPWPVNWAELFGREAPLILEIGFGRGQFLQHLARRFPDFNIVGLEISNRCLVVAENAIERLALNHVRVIHSTAEAALLHLFEPATLSQVHINFPDPWFKARHSRRRLMQRDTLDTLVNRLQPGGLLYLATDIIEYAGMSAQLLAATPGLDNLLPTAWASAMPDRVITKYEAAAERDGRDRYYFAYSRNVRPAPHVPVVKELEMPHIVFSGPLGLDEVQAAFAPWQAVADETILHFIDCYRGRDTLLFETYVKEETLDQRIALVLHARPTGDYSLMVSPLGHPRATAGVHAAVAALARWLFSLSPEMKLTDSKVRDFAPQA